MKERGDGAAFRRKEGRQCPGRGGREGGKGGREGGGEGRMAKNQRGEGEKKEEEE